MGAFMNTALRVLIVEDSENDAVLLIRHIKRSGYEIIHERVDSAAAMSSALEKSQWDFIIADYAMPSFSGSAALALLKSKGLDIPFIIVSGTIGEDVAVEAMKAGAHDYVMKGNLTRLIPAIQRELDEAEVRRERKRAETALRNSEERYRSLFEESKDAIYISTVEGKFLDINQAGIELFGYASKEEALNGNIDQDIYNENPVRKQFKEKILTDGYVRDFEQIMKRKDGNIITILETASSVYNENGAAIMYRGIMRDITQQKILEQQLIMARKMESIGTLAGGVAHDFNNILGIILGYCSLIEKENCDPKKILESANAINKAVERGAGLVQQILTFARKTEIAFMPIHLPDVVHELVSMLEQTFPKIISIKESFAPSIPDIYADRTQINQALLNLCVNARDAMPNGGMLFIKVNTLVKEQVREKFINANQEQYVCLSVTDTGQGMNEATRIRVFDPFFTTKEGGKGTGLGLSVVYGVVQAHHGFIDLESELGCGTTFRIYFPISITYKTDTDKKEQINPFEPGGTETILVVEDETSLLKVLELTLSAKGYTIYTAEDGISAVNIYNQYNDEIQLILSDIGLPGINGLAEFQQLKKINPDVKIIFASGYFEPTTKNELHQAGAKGFLQKPYKTAEVLTKIREVLDAK
jgi:two-component system, cell cycle sensor histidine kinase and response regulator CckA